MTNECLCADRVLPAKSRHKRDCTLESIVFDVMHFLSRMVTGNLCYLNHEAGSIASPMGGSFSGPQRPSYRYILYHSAKKEQSCSNQQPMHALPEATV